MTGFIDFDHLPTGPRVRDLAYYLASRLRTHLRTPETRLRDTTAFIAALASYVAGYHHAYPLTEKERDAVVALMLLVEIKRTLVTAREPNPDNYQRTLDSIAWITTHFIQLTPAARNAPLVPRSPGLPR